MQHRTHRAQSGKGCLLLLENSKFCGEQETTSFRCHWRQAPYKWAIYRWQLQMERTVLRTTKIVPAAALSIPSSYWGNSVRTLIISCTVFVSALQGKCYLCRLSCPRGDQHYSHHKLNSLNQEKRLWEFVNKLPKGNWYYVWKNHLTKGALEEMMQNTTFAVCVLHEKNISLYLFVYDCARTC